jgi:hypothetical protein
MFHVRQGAYSMRRVHWATYLAHGVPCYAQVIGNKWDQFLNMMGSDYTER